MKNLLLLVLFFGGFTALGQETLHSSTLTFGVGGIPYSYNWDSQKGGPSFTGNYEYRLLKYLAVESGTDILLPSGKSFVNVASSLSGQNLVSYFNQSVCPPSCLLLLNDRSRVALLTYGLKGILPLAKNRLELFAGLGGAYAWNSEFSGRLNGPLAQASLGGRLALDRGHRFWLGTTLRGATNFGSARQAWVPLTIDLGIRFGR